jgi:hypothetical protein
MELAVTREHSSVAQMQAQVIAVYLEVATGGLALLRNVGLQTGTCFYSSHTAEWAIQNA